MTDAGRSTNGSQNTNATSPQQDPREAADALRATLERLAAGDPTGAVAVLEALAVELAS